MNKKILLISTLVILLFPAICLAFQGRCVKVLDGDTIIVLGQGNKETRVRIYGVDCPEKSQAFGQKAKEFTLDLVGGKQVKVDVIDMDFYKRSVGVVSVGGKCLNEELLKFGYAWLYGQYCKKDFCRKWRDLETRAKINKMGLWGDPHAQAPWEYRRKGKRSKGTSSKVSHPASVSGKYHGNAGSHTFHQPGGKHYDCKNCTVNFGSREDAVKAGYDMDPGTI